MNYLYAIRYVDGRKYFEYLDKVSIFGSVNGFIPRILKNIIIKSNLAYYKWHINLSNDLPKIGFNNHSVVIDLKPENKDNVSLYELINVFGYSCNGWTPMMFHLKGIFIDEKDEGIKGSNKKSFSYDPIIADNIFTFHHVYDGSIENGEVVGKWIPPKPSSTNSALLWEEVFDYFYECRNSIKEIERTNDL